MLPHARRAGPGLAAAAAVVMLAGCGGQSAAPAPAPPHPNAPLPARPSLWVAKTPVGHVTARVRLAGGPTSVAYARGSVWVTHDDGHLSRIDPRTARIVRRARTGRFPVSIAFSPGAVWIANSADDTVSRIDLRTGRPTATVAVGDQPTGLATAAGALWVANGLDDTVSRIDPDTGAVQETIPVGERPSGIAVSAHAVWVANGGGTVSRIEPRTNRVSKTIRVGGSPAGVAASGGSVWASVAQTAPSPRLPAGTSGGVAHFDVEDDFDFTDPALAYFPTSWQLEYATCAKLLNYPDRPAPAGSQLVPEVAESLPAVSASGKRYTFTIRDGYRFSPPSNQRVTAQTFKYSIERSLSPKLVHSFAAQFVGDIVGVRAYREGRAQHISGVVARGNTLTVELTRGARELPARLAMPFFCAVPIGTPADPNGLRAIPSAGPYYVASYTPNQQVVVRRNPNYRGPRPHRLDEILYTLGVAQVRTVAQIEARRADYAADGVPPAAAARLAARYGTRSAAARAGKKQYFTEPLLAVAYLALNTSRPLFANANLRKAVNYAIDRPALRRQATASSKPLGEPTDQYLPPGIPGFNDVHIYPLHGPEVATARRLAAGRGGHAVLYTCNVAPCPQQAQIVRANLKAIGIDVEVKEFPHGVLGTKAGTRGEPFDMVLNGWISDYPDPFNFLNTLLDGGGIKAHGSSNWAYFDDPAYNRKLESAAALSGPQRYRAYATLDADVARNAAPLVAIANYARRDFFSARMGCQVYQPVYGFDLAALCLRHASG